MGGLGASTGTHAGGLKGAASCFIGSPAIRPIDVAVPLPPAVSLRATATADAYLHGKGKERVGVNFFGGNFWRRNDRTMIAWAWISRTFHA